MRSDPKIHRDVTCFSNFFEETTFPFWSSMIIKSEDDPSVLMSFVATKMRSWFKGTIRERNLFYDAMKMTFELRPLSPVVSRSSRLSSVRLMS